MMIISLSLARDKSRTEISISTALEANALVTMGNLLFWRYLLSLCFIPIE